MVNFLSKCSYSLIIYIFHSVSMYSLPEYIVSLFTLPVRFMAEAFEKNSNVHTHTHIASLPLIHSTTLQLLFSLKHCVFFPVVFLCHVLTHLPLTFQHLAPITFQKLFSCYMKSPHLLLCLICPPIDTGHCFHWLVLPFLPAAYGVCLGSLLDCFSLSDGFLSFCLLIKCAWSSWLSLWTTFLSGTQAACIDGSPPGPAVPGILQARTLEWVAISFSMHLLSNYQIACSEWGDSKSPSNKSLMSPVLEDFTVYRWQVGGAGGRDKYQHFSSHSVDFDWVRVILGTQRSITNTDIR